VPNLKESEGKLMLRACENMEPMGEGVVDVFLCSQVFADEI